MESWADEQSEAQYVPKRLDLDPAEVLRLEAEKRELLKAMKAQMMPSAESSHRPGHVTVGDETLMQVANETESPLKPALTFRITADGRKLAGLMSKAKKLEAAAEAIGEKANAARQAAYTARLDLNAYMQETGLA